VSSPFLKVPESEWVASNPLAFAIRDRYPVSPGHTLVIPRRLVATWFEATLEEQRALFELVDVVKRDLDESQKPDGYNLGINVGEAAGQTVLHLHVHVIPRYRGDMEDPRGGVRHVIPSKGNYLVTPAKPLATGGLEDSFLRHLEPLFARATEVAVLAAFVAGQRARFRNAIAGRPGAIWIYQQFRKRSAAHTFRMREEPFSVAFQEV
jgi:diadenosine tetraphosphate (Ap4A) HIT family hydrolase